jgi:AraC-like DNA-binding protein
MFVRSSHLRFGKLTIMDPLADVLDVSRVGGALLAHVRAHDPWGIALPATPGASFHAFTAGTAWLRVGNAPPLQLMPGDVLLLPTGIEHELASRPDGPARAYDRLAKEQAMGSDGDLVLPGAGACTRFLCAAYDYDHEVAHPLLSLLPGVLHIPADPPGDASPVQMTLRLLTAELGGRSEGSRAVVDRLVDVLFVQVVRAWLHASTDGDASWLRALRDPAVAGALALLHDQPQRAWTVQELAHEVHLSRATLARRFTELVGEPPLAYLTRWRMDLAARRLRETTDPVGVVAAGVGYSSEYAFSRAFSRMRGEPPGRYRRAQQVVAA